MAASRLHHQNTTRASPTTPYNANTHSSPGSTLTDTNTTSTDSGSTATPPPTRSIDTLDHNRSNTCHYRPKDSRRRNPNTRDNGHHQDHKPAKRGPRVARPEPPTTRTQAAPSTKHQQHPRHQTTTRHANHHRGTLTVGNTNTANTHGNINTTTNPTNNEPRYRHLQHPYNHHHDPGTE